MPASYNFKQLYTDSHHASYVRTRKSPGGILDMVDLVRPGGDMSHPGLPELVLYQDQLGGSRVSVNNGSGLFNAISEQGAFYLSPPHLAQIGHIESSHQMRGLSFSPAQWQNVLDEASEGRLSVETLRPRRGFFHSPSIRSAVQNLWLLSQEEGVPSRLLVRAAGCEILAELLTLSGAPLPAVKGGLSPLARRRAIEAMRARISEDISLDELAAEAGLSAFHFARMFKQSVGVPPRVYLTQLRMEKAIALLESTELSVIEIAQEVGYSSGQVLARIFLKHYRRSPTDYRRIVRTS